MFFKICLIKILQNLQENICARVSYSGLNACNFIKKETLAQAFPLNFVKLIRTPFLYNTPVAASALSKSEEYTEP